MNQEVQQDDLKKSSKENKTKKKASSNSSIDTGTIGSSSTQAESLVGNRNVFQRLIHYKHFLSICMIIAVILGNLIGFYLKFNSSKKYWTQRKKARIGFPGELFNNILSCIREPVTCTSIIAAVGSMDKRICRIIGVRGFIIALFLNAVGAAVGVLFVIPLAIFKPKDQDLPYRHFCHLPNQEDVDYNTSCIDENTVFVDPNYPCVLGIDYLFNLLRLNVPRNLVKSFYGRGARVVIDFHSPSDSNVSTYEGCYEFLVDHSITDLQDLEKYDLLTIPAYTPGLWFLSFVIGVCAMSVGEPAQSFMNLFISLSEIFLTIANWALYLAPVGICFGTIKSILDRETDSFLLPSVQWFMITVFLAVLCNCFIVLPVLYWVFTKKSPIRFLLAILPAMGTAFGTSKSVSAISVAINRLEEVAHVDPRVVRYLTPILANTSYNALGLFAASFIAYLAFNNSVPLKLSDYLSIIWICTITPIADIRSGSHYVASAVGLTLASLKLDMKLTAEIFATTWIIIPLLVMGNVTADCFVIAVVNYSCRRDLIALTLEDEKKMKMVEVAGVNRQWDELYEQTTETITAPELPDQVKSTNQH